MKKQRCFQAFAGCIDGAGLRGFARSAGDWVQKLINVGRLKKEFSGIIRYETTFAGRVSAMDLGRCYEAVSVFVNDLPAGTRIGYPYRYELTGLTRDGENRLRIEAATTLAGALTEPVSAERAVPPPGVFGPICVAN